MTQIQTTRTPSLTRPPVRAYQVSSDDENAAVVVFAVHNVSARRSGAAELDEEYTSVRCRRAPMFDAYADAGEVPVPVLIENGWWQRCTQCGDHVHQDSIAEGRHTLILQGSVLLCSEACQAKRTARIDAELNKQAAARRDAVTRYPGVHIGTWSPGEVGSPGHLTLQTPGPDSVNVGYVPGQYVPGQYVPGQYVPGQYVPGQYVPGQEPIMHDDDRPAWGAYLRSVT